MKTPTLFFEKRDIEDFLRGYWRTPEFKKSHATGGLVARIVEKYTRLPRFFYEMSDERLERAHFSIWWSGIALRDYKQDSCHDLYMLHELAHGADMVHIAGQHSENFRRKMGDNELLASITTEVIAYFDMPTLRPQSFTGEIFADRFLSDPALQARWKEDPERLLSELYYRRRNAMFYPNRDDAVEMWLNGFTMSNDKWFGIWGRNYDKVEVAMENLTRGAALGKRREALLRHMDWLETVTTDSIPFLPEARKFADVYWAEKDMAVIQAA